MSKGSSSYEDWFGAGFHVRRSGESRKERLSKRGELGSVLAEGLDPTERLRNVEHCDENPRLQFDVEAIYPPNIGRVREASPKISKERPLSLIAARLRVAQDETDRAALGKLAHDLYLLCKNSSERSALQSWLAREADEWIKDRRPALAAVIEVCARLALPETIRVIVSALADDDANLQVASVAAQRIRWLSVTDAELRRRLGGLLQTWIDRWLQTPDTKQNALLALPSTARLLWESERGWLIGHIAADDNDVAWAMSQGVLEVAGTPRLMIDTDVADELFAASLARRNRLLARQDADHDVAVPDLNATLIWVLAAVATEKNLETVADLLRRSFEKPRGLEAAAAVEAGRLIVQRWGQRAMTALLVKFAASRSLSRYLALLVQGK